MRYLSLCSGIEAASVAWGQYGFTPVGLSEIESFPCSVLKHHYPDVPNFGDMTKFEEWNIEPSSVDVVVGGTPCQSFSIAGLRGGLDDGRGNLALTYCRILQKFKPRWFVWENVPGAISSYSDEAANSQDAQDDASDETEDVWQSSDFATILSGFRECGYSVSGRILDAQYFGVPQRRRRIFVVGYLGNWRCPAEVLFESGCLRGNSKASSKKRKDVAGTLASRASACGELGTDFDLDGGVQVSCTLPASTGGVSSGNHPVVAALTARPYADQVSAESKLVAYQCQGTNVGPMGTFRAGNGNETGGVPFIATSTGDKSHCLNAGGMGRQDYETETMVVAFTQNQREEVREIRTAGALSADPGTHQSTFLATKNTSNDIVDGISIGVRRLTPIECERLQGFPDNYTNVMHRGKPASDGPRYKSLGNSMAVPVMAWIGKRIMQVENKNAEV